MATLWEEKFEVPDVSEAHWSTSTIMAVFIAASLVSAVFFGLGYSFGRGGTSKPVLHAAASAPADASDSTLERQSQETAMTPGLREVATVSTPTTLRAVDVGAAASPQLAQRTLHPAAGAPSQRATPALAREHKQPRALEQDRFIRKAANSKPSGLAHYMVQVGAVADHKDAQMLVSQLRKHGFHAGIYSAKHDRFLHVQIGPFANVQQAQSMRHHVMTSGYRAILKRAA